MARLQTKGMVWVSCSVLLAGVGCANSPVPVEGVVRHNGKPLEGATVIFSPEDPALAKGGHHQASAITDKEGRFHLQTANAQGAFTGRYKVTVSKRAYPPGVRPPQNMAEAQQMIALQKETLPARYAQMEQTPLQFEIPKGGSKKLELDIEQR